MGTVVMCKFGKERESATGHPLAQAPRPGGIEGGFEHIGVVSARLIRRIQRR